MGFISLPISVIDKSYWSALLRRILRQCLRFVGQSNVIGDFPGGPVVKNLPAALKAGALGQPRGMRWGGRWEGGSGPERGGGAHVCPWLIHVDVLQGPPQCCEVTVFQLK